MSMTYGSFAQIAPWPPTVLWHLTVLWLNYDSDIKVKHVGIIWLFARIVIGLGGGDQLKNCRVTDSPILFALVQGLQACVVERPATSCTWVSLMNLIE